MNILLKVKRFDFDYKLSNSFSLDLNESSLYMFRIKSMNIYGESPWSMETPVQTTESIITSDGNEN